MADENATVATNEEPLFDPSLKKKKKKKAVAFNEDPLGLDAGDEPPREASVAPAEPGPSILKKVEGDDVGEEMFEGLKKKKKKKELPLDLVSNQ
jgi:translation initiation factor 2 subunit 2